jgi:formamidopyrimidine-DNA glycosylase
MAVHGKANEPCPRCQAPVQRIAYADNETNYCAPCQTNGRLLADRALSRLLKDDFPRTLDDLEALKKEHRQKASSSSSSAAPGPPAGAKVKSSKPK